VIPTTDVIKKGTPTGWRNVPFWSLFRRTKKTGFPEEELLSVYRDYGVIPKSSRDDNHNKESEDLSGYQLVTEGALVTNKMKAWQGSIAISRYRGIVSPAYYVYTPQSDEWDQFLHYLLRSDPYIGLYRRISKGVRVSQWDLEHQALRNIPVFLPDLPTQRAIADFLDRETARIDSLIEKKQRLVALLEEKRSASITGEIAKHPMVKRLKHVANLLNGYAFKSELFGDAGIPIVMQTTLKSGRIQYDGRCYPPEMTPPRYLLRGGDLCIGMSGSIENFGVVLNSDLPAALNQRVGALRVIEGKCIQEFLPYYVQSSVFKDHISSNLPATTIVNIDAHLISNAPFPAISFAEQVELVDKLSTMVARHEQSSRAIENSIDRLTEYRSALITSAVTGQIDVTTWSRKGNADRQLDAIQSDVQA
jgi:type I restriction enzyme, S subunit